jgi:hypothetical protein
MQSRSCTTAINQALAIVNSSQRVRSDHPNMDLLEIWKTITKMLSSQIDNPNPNPQHARSKPARDSACGKPRAGRQFVDHFSEGRGAYLSRQETPQHAHHSLR